MSFPIIRLESYGIKSNSIRRLRIDFQNKFDIYFNDLSIGYFSD